MPQSTLLGLPPELRLIIYEYLIPDLSPMSAADGRTICTLLHSCRQIRNDSQSVFVQALQVAAVSTKPLWKHSLTSSTSVSMSSTRTLPT